MKFTKIFQHFLCRSNLCPICPIEFRNGCQKQFKKDKLAKYTALDIALNIKKAELDIALDKRVSKRVFTRLRREYEYLQGLLPPDVPKPKSYNKYDDGESWKNKHKRKKIE